MISTSIEERIDIVESAAKGEPTWRMARRMPWSPRTIQKWRRKGQQEGRPGLASKMGRPATGALGSYSEEVRATLRRWRAANPGWGPTTLHAELQRHPAFAEMKVPSRASIARFLAAEGLITAQEPTVALPASAAIHAGHAHQVWEMDARGYEKIPDVGLVTLINLNDRFSHTRLLSYPCYLGQERVVRHAQTADYQATLRTAFMAWGLPQALQVDHEGVFYHNKSKSPFPTRFHLWLIALGISLSFIRYRQPEDQGMTERSHQLWYQQVIQGHTFPNWTTLYDALHKRQQFLNYHLPCRTLNNQPPLVAHPEAIHSGRAYALVFEEEMLDLARVYAYLAQGQWFRCVSKSGTLSLGGQVYSLGTKWRHQQVQITFNQDALDLCFYSSDGSFITAKALKGLSKARLMGDIADMTRLPTFQMALPFSWEQIQDARLFETIS